MRLAFMGTPAFSVPTLSALAEAGFEIAAVYTQPPRPAGRGKKLRESPVHARARELGLDVRTPENFKTEENRAAFAALGLDAAVVVAYGLILPRAVLDAPRHGCWNLHASLLPRWRGAAPIQRAIMAGDAETGAGVMRMEAGLDTGPVAVATRLRIGPAETAGELEARLAEAGAPAMVAAMKQLERDGALPTDPQPEEGALYAAKIDKAEARIDWTRTASEVDRHIRGLAPFPGAWTMAGDERLKVLLATPVEGAGAPGEVLDDALTVACGEGAVRIEKAQRPGKAAMARDDLLRGFTAPKGAVFI